ncbi:MAG: hypothetical protein AAGF83_24900 [Cyanobacteria bacterium P01_G01_bin.67]
MSIPISEITIEDIVRLESPPINLAETFFSSKAAVKQQELESTGGFIGFT